MGIIDDNKKIYGHLTSAIRRIWLYYSTERKKAVERTKLAPGRYQCERCKQIFKQKDLQVHHTIPVGSIKDGFDNYMLKLFCSAGELKTVCKECHKQEHEDLKKNIFKP